MDDAMSVRGAPRCKGVTSTGRPCRRRAAAEGFCRQHGTAAFYARAFPAQDRAAFEEALAQDGLDGEVAVLRLHLLRLLRRDDRDKPAEIPRTIHALVRALKDGRGPADDPRAALDAAVREEGRRWLEEGAARDVRHGEE